jgi:hypothetical protein
MDAARKRLGWKIGVVVLVAFACAAVFSAYLRPDMLVTFGDIMAFCAALIR